MYTSEDNAKRSRARLAWQWCLGWLMTLRHMLGVSYGRRALRREHARTVLSKLLGVLGAAPIEKRDQRLDAARAGDGNARIVVVHGEFGEGAGGLLHRGHVRCAQAGDEGSDPQTRQHRLVVGLVDAQAERPERVRLGLRRRWPFGGAAKQVDQRLGAASLGDDQVRLGVVAHDAPEHLDGTSLCDVEARGEQSNQQRRDLRLVVRLGVGEARQRVGGMAVRTLVGCAKEGAQTGDRAGAGDRHLVHVVTFREGPERTCSLRLYESGGGRGHCAARVQGHAERTAAAALLYLRRLEKHAQPRQAAKVVDHVLVLCVAATDGAEGEGGVRLYVERVRAAVQPAGLQQLDERPHPTHDRDGLLIGSIALCDLRRRTSQAHGAA